MSLGPIVPVESRTGAVAAGLGETVAGGFRLEPVPHSSPWLRFRSPLIELDGRISRIQLSDWVHVKAHDKAPRGSRPSFRTPKSVYTAAPENRRVPRVDTLWRRRRKPRTQSYT